VLFIYFLVLYLLICFIFVENPIVVDELAELGTENNPIIISDDDEDEPVRHQRYAGTSHGQWQ